MSGTQSWLLKVLSGPHLGAEVLLSGESYRIGSDSECDIVLADASVRPCHATLERVQEGWRLTAVGGPVLVEEEPLTPGQTRVLNEAEVFALGTTYLGCGPAAMDWSGRVLPAAVLVPAAETPASPMGESPRKSRLAGRPWLLGVLSFAGLTFLLLMVGWLFLLEPGNAALSVPSERERLDRLVARFPLRGVKLRHTPSGWTVAGWCDRESDRHRFRKALVGLPFPVVSRVRSLEAMVASAKEVARGMDDGGGLRIAAAGDGRLEVSGRLADDARERKLLRLLREDVPGVVEVIDRIETPKADDEAPVIGMTETALEKEAFGRRVCGIVHWEGGGYVIFDDLASLPLGAVVDGRWRIRRIGDRRVWLSDGERTIIRYVGERL